MEGTGGEGGFQFWWILNPALQKGLPLLAPSCLPLQLDLSHLLFPDPTLARKTITSTWY